MADTAVAAQGDAAKLAALRRTKFVATAALVLCVAVFLAARALQPIYPALAFVAAFAEAAAIGGIADWYAVVALFRRPLGLPIPHTAIIPRNQVRIADNLGGFIEANFLAPGPVRARLAEVDFAALIADWLSSERRSEGLSRFVLRLTPRMLDAVEGTDLRGFVTQRVAAQLDKVRLAPLAADVLSAFTAERRHQRILDNLLKVFAGLLTDEVSLAAIRDRIRDELPTLARVFRADAYLLRKIVASAATLMEEVAADPEHPVRREFDRLVESFVHDLRKSPDYAARAEQLKRDLLARPELRNLAGDVWASFRTFAERDAAAPDSAIGRNLTNLFMEVGRQLAADPQVRADMNVGFVVALASFVERQKSGVTRFISDQVKAWDLGQLTHLIELNIGRDLQYIRFNGMLIGGTAGLLLHVGERLIFGN
jgi:uncharacterized membrane-anchored protein YjiN (DUF445 family)